MSKIKRKAFFLIKDTANGLERQQPHLSIQQFSDLVKTCNLETVFAKSLPSTAQAKEYELIFIDIFNADWVDDIPYEIQQLTNHGRVVFFNAFANKYDEIKLMLSNVQGIFYQDERLDIIMRGITQLLNSQRWFKRETMNSALDKLMSKVNHSDTHSNSPPLQSINLPSLTRRENTIIGLVSRGAKNQEIADRLHISPNTVKTHLYSIFRKTSSRNRIELISWTQNYLATVS